MARLVLLGQFLQRIDTGVGDLLRVVVEQVRIECFPRRAVRERDHPTVRIQHLDHRIQCITRAVDIQPDLGAGLGSEHVHVDIAWRTQEPVDLEPHPIVLVPGGFRGGQVAQELGRVHRGVDPGRRFGR